jgi:small conductance mechanosensitive channel
MDFSRFDFSHPISSDVAETAFFISLTLLIAVVVNHLLRSLIRIPKHFDSRRARTYATVFRNVVTVVVYGVALQIILLELHINITPLLASAGIIGIIVGLGARAVVEDLLSGIFLLTQDSIAVGDYIKVEDSEGYIESIGIRSLSMRGENGALYIIPNGQIKRLVNFSRHKSHVFIDIPLKADQKVDAVIVVLKQALVDLHSDPDLGASLYPGSSVDGVETFTLDGKVVLRVSVLTTPGMRHEAARKYRYLVKKAFEKHKLVLG